MKVKFNGASAREDVFPFRVHRVKEVAVRYFPHLTPNSGTRALRRIIYGDQDLLNSMREHGYALGQRSLTPAMLNVLTAYLGSPEDFCP